MSRDPLDTYRQQEMRFIAHWLEAGDSGAVVGLAGAGKSNFLRFLCNQPAAIARHFHTKEQTVIPIEIDLNDLPAYDLSTFYRVILRAFHENVERFEPHLRQSITDIFQTNKAAQDPFLPQTALRELFAQFKVERLRVALVLDRFEYFCEVAPPQLLNTLRGLRDNSKETLCYLVGLRHELRDLTKTVELDELHELLDGHTCWVGPMAEDDARQLIVEETHTASREPGLRETKAMLTLTGHHPALLKATCRWWRTQSDGVAINQWATALLADQGIQNRLSDIWHGLNQVEKLVLSELQSEKKPSTRTSRALEAKYRHTLEQLAAKGICEKKASQWYIRGRLLVDFIDTIDEKGRGRMRYDEEGDKFYQGDKPLTLPDRLHRACSFSTNTKECA